MNASADDYDTPWKDALTRYFPDFMAFYFHDAYLEIDWNRPYVFLEQELAQVVRDAKLGQRRVDKLMHDISQLERNRNMPYISSFERKGREEGLREGRQEVLRELLIGRFGALPQATEDRVAKATLSELKAWTKAVMNAPTLESVFGRH